jgi:hypothetical protein
MLYNYKVTCSRCIFKANALGGRNMSYWNGSYEDSTEGQQTLEDDIFDAGLGKFAYPCGSGTIKETQNSINVYFPDSNDPSGHSHMGVNRNGDFYQK